MKRVVLGVLVLAVCGMMVAPMGMAGKPQPPAPVEPFTNIPLVMTSSPQLLAVSDYARIWSWENNQLVHKWSGISVHGAGVIGDADNDNNHIKDLVIFDSQRTGNGNNGVITTRMKIWKNGDTGNSPSINISVPMSPNYIAIGNPDGDSYNEIVMHNVDNIRIWRCIGSSCSEVASLGQIGGGGLTVADADNDGVDEILVGMGANENGWQAKGVVIDYKTDFPGTHYKVVALLGVGCIDEMSVGDLDGVAGNEIFGSGYNGGNIFVWRFDKINNVYCQIWTEQRTAGFEQSNEVADVNGDGVKEIVFSEMVIIPDPKGKTSTHTDDLLVYKYIGNDKWTQMGKYSPCPDPQDNMVSGNLDGDAHGYVEIVVSGTVWSWDGSAMINIQNIADPSKPPNVSLM